MDSYVYSLICGVPWHGVRNQGSDFFYCLVGVGLSENLVLRICAREVNRGVVGDCM